MVGVMIWRFEPAGHLQSLSARFVEARPKTRAGERAGCQSLTAALVLPSGPSNPPRKRDIMGEARASARAASEINRDETRADQPSE